MKTMKLAMLPLLLIGALSVSWYYFTGGPFLVATPDPHANAYGHIFSVVPPVMDAQNISQSNTRDRMIFLNFDDGRFLFTNAPDSIDTLQVIYAYRVNGNGNTPYEPYAESTEIYSDKKPPPSVARMVMESNNPVNPYSSLIFTQHLSIGSNELSTMDPYKIAMTGPIKMASTRRIVPESGLTYVVTVENTRRGTESVPSCGSVNAAVTLNYDSSVLQFKGAKDGYSHTKYQDTTINPGFVNINLLNMRESEQRSLVYVFVTKPDIKQGTEVEIPTASVSFTSTGSTPLSLQCAGAFYDSIPEQSVVFDTHDPNHKMITPNAFCINESRDLTYRIDFQNDGFAPTKTIVIEDELDFLYEETLPASNLTYAKAYLGGLYHSAPVPVKIGDRKYKFTLENAALNGIHQAGYGIKFSDASTKGFLEFKVHTNRLRTKPTCSAVCNQAKIFFDCNPPIVTNTALSKTNCFDCTACADTTIIDSARGVLKGVVEVLNHDSQLETVIQSRLGANRAYKWYPASKVSEATNLYATATASEMTNYTLIVSSTDPERCGRIIYKRTFIPGCNLQVNASYSTTSTSGCPNQWKYTINADVSGQYNPAFLSWTLGSTCPSQSGGLNFTKSNVTAGSYKIIVTDTKSGCTAEAVVNIPLSPIIVDDVPGDCNVDLIVKGGKEPYSYQWQWDGHMQAETGKQLDPRGKLNIVVTVTDANGCNKVFRPAENCPVQQAGSWKLFSVIGIGVAGAAFWLYKKRNPVA